jgi:hypothetical protein
MWQAKEETGSNLRGERQNNLRKDRTEPILIWKRFELCFLLTILVLPIAKILYFFLNKPEKAGELILELALWYHRQQSF